MIRYKNILLLMAVCFGITVVVAGPAYALNQLKDINLQKAGDSVAVIITTGQPCEFHPFLTSTKPERIVVDLTDVVNVWSQKKFLELPAKSIDAIRTSQFVAKPVPVTRVVLDIGRPIDFRSFRNGNDVVIKIPAVEDETDFAAWNVRDAVQQATEVAEKPVAKPVEPVEKPPAAKPAEKQLAAKPAEKEEAKPKRKGSGVEIESYPKRKLVAYQTSQYRDPFEPLIGASGGQLMGDLPILDNLVLVGILSNEDGNRALLEDAEGNGYILMPKDRIKNGYLVSVTDTKAIFQVTEYGWTRTVALELDLAEIK